jgi:hypothetical protein
MFVAACSLPRVAAADAVSPPPDDCPPGSIGSSGHTRGPHCEPLPCDDDDDCDPELGDRGFLRRGTVCEEVGLCEIDEPSEDGEAYPVAISACDPGTCHLGACVVARRCVEPPRAGDDCPVGSVWMPIGPSPYCSPITCTDDDDCPRRGSDALVCRQVGVCEAVDVVVHDPIDMTFGPRTEALAACHPAACTRGDCVIAWRCVPSSLRALPPPPPSLFASCGCAVRGGPASRAVIVAFLVAVALVRRHRGLVGSAGRSSA